MKKSKDKPSKSRTRSDDTNDDLDEMREAFRRHKSATKGGGGGKSDFDKLDDGKNLRRVLPIPEARKFYTEGWTHFGVGPNERAVRCIDEGKIDPERALPQSGTKCPRCKRFLREQARINSEYKKGDSEGQAEWGRMKQKYCARHQYYSNVLREDDEGDFEIKIMAYGPQIWGQLMNYYLTDDSNVGDFTHPESGTWLNFKKEDKGGNKPGRRRRNVEYKVYPVDDGPSIEDGWGDIKEALHDLDLAAGNVLSVEEFVAIEKGVDSDKDPEDGRRERRRSRDEDDDDSEDDRRSSRRRSRDDDDDDDEDGGDDDRDDEDDDEDDRRVDVKKSKLSKKMKRRD